MTKKLIAMVLTAVMLAGVLTGCGSIGTVQNTEPAAQNTQATEDNPTSPRLRLPHGTAASEASGWKMLRSVLKNSTRTSPLRREKSDATSASLPAVVLTDRVWHSPL
jgi:hypothetical protein